MRKPARLAAARGWAGLVATAVLLGGATFAVARPHDGAGRTPGAAAGRFVPCGGEQLGEDTFPPQTPLAMPAPAAAASTASSAAAPPGGTRDAPGAPDGRPEEYTPDDAAFQALLQREGATILMSRFSTGFTHASPSQAANIALVARKLTGVVIAPGALFSYNRAVGPFTAAGGFGWGRMFLGDRIVPSIGGGVCQGASTLYNVVLLANLQVVERHRHGLTVPYLQPGRDATVAESGGLDFRFRNNTGGPVVLWGQADDRRLTLAAYGVRTPPRVEIETEILSRTPFRTEVLTDPGLPPGQEQVAAAGQEGAHSRTYLVVFGPDGPRRRLLSDDTYRPSPRIVLRGPKPRGSSTASPAASTASAGSSSATGARSASG